MAKGKVTFYKGKQTGMLIKREEKDKSEVHSMATGKDVGKMSTAEIQKGYATKAKEQEQTRKKKKK